MKPNTPGFLRRCRRSPRARTATTASTSRSGRSHPENPLTARVVVNRLWRMFFGYGIAAFARRKRRAGATPDAPGVARLAGERVPCPEPSTAPHSASGSSRPRSAWDIRHIVRLMVMSSAYRQSSVESPEIREPRPDGTNSSRGKLASGSMRNVIRDTGTLCQRLAEPAPSAGRA